MWCIGHIAYISRINYYYYYLQHTRKKTISNVQEQQIHMVYYEHKDVQLTLTYKHRIAVFVDCRLVKCAQVLDCGFGFNSVVLKGECCASCEIGKW